MENMNAELVEVYAEELVNKKKKLNKIELLMETLQGNWRENLKRIWLTNHLESIPVHSDALYGLKGICPLLIYLFDPRSFVPVHFVLLYTLC